MGLHAMRSSLRSTLLLAGGILLLLTIFGQRVFPIGHDAAAGIGVLFGARGVGGDWSHFGPIENEHRRHILDLSMAPAAVPAATAALG